MFHNAQIESPVLMCLFWWRFAWKCGRINGIIIESEHHFNTSHKIAVWFVWRWHQCVYQWLNRSIRGFLFDWDVWVPPPSPQPWVYTFSLFQRHTLLSCHDEAIFMQISEKPGMAVICCGSNVHRNHQQGVRMGWLTPLLICNRLRLMQYSYTIFYV